METVVRVIVYYETIDGSIPFKTWLKSLKDKSVVGRIRARLERIERGLWRH